MKLYHSLLCCCLGICLTACAPQSPSEEMNNGPAYSEELSIAGFVSNTGLRGREPTNLSPPVEDKVALCFAGLTFKAATLDSLSPPVPLFDQLGNLAHPVTTQSAKAQAYFNQGLRLVYGFNHYEAHRSFMEAARLDPDCAMAYWGQALALAPNINLPIDKERNDMGYEAIQKALTLRSKASATEREYIEAMAKRFSKEVASQRSQLDSVYAVAMGKLANTHPNDPDANSLYADALMNRMPWNYWLKDGQPKPGVPEAIAKLETVIKRFPGHPGAHHLYIHLVEASPNPDRAIPSAEKLAALMPGAGHLVHMPSHIYLRVGRYAHAVESNRQAVDVDEKYMAQYQPTGVYSMMYYPHNIHFIWASATMEGKSKVAIEAAKKTAAKVPGKLMASIFPLQEFYMLPMYSLLRFGKWNEALTLPYPGKEFRHASAMWHYARGMAYAAQGRIDMAEKEWHVLDSLSKDTSLDTCYASQNSTSRVLAIANRMVGGVLENRKKNYPEAIRMLKEAAQLEDDLRYDEPRSWHHPVRQTLGAVLLEANLPAEAEVVYLEDLKVNRENGWSLFGLQQSLQMQGKKEEALKAEQRFKKAWANADVKLTASRF
jgi:tetratricopeptide (TPR) repeat protein